MFIYLLYKEHGATLNKYKCIAHMGGYIKCKGIYMSDTSKHLYYELAYTLRHFVEIPTMQRYIYGMDAPLGADRVLPARRGKRTGRLGGIRAELRRAFPARKYGRRALVESIFSRGQRKLSARAPGRSLFTQQRPALLLGLAFNL